MLTRLTERIMDFLLVLVGARHLGHGRRMELFLVAAAGYYAVVLSLVHNATAHSSATADLFWSGYGPYVHYAVYSLFAVKFYGLFGNVYVWPASRWVRCVGGIGGFALWGWIGMKLALIGLISAPGHVLATMVAFYGELGVLFMAAANRPLPGAPGNRGDVLSARQ